MILVGIRFISNSSITSFVVVFSSIIRISSMINPTHIIWFIITVVINSI
nr:MAG TPA_asm: hypothetical protein [Caudoviricetes sp.]